MASFVTIYLPSATDVVIKAFTNSSYLQRVTVTPAGARPIVFTGSGEGNNLIGRTHYTTPSGDDATADVSVDFSRNSGGTWQQADIFYNSCTVNAYNLVVVVSADFANEGYNDSVCMISWPEQGGLGASNVQHGHIESAE